jgi:hypothetical protein
MINIWIDRRTMIDLLARLRKTGGNSVVKAVPWGYFRILKDGNGAVIFEVKDHSRARLIHEVVHHYEQGTNI